MKVLQLHNRYTQLGGEDTVVASERELLNSHGHQVDQFIVSNEDVTPSQWLGIGLRTAGNHGAMLAVERKIRECRPDIVHVHNFFPRLSTSVYNPCARHNVPVVQTLHNYRPLCLAATFLRNGIVCEQCLGNHPGYGVLHRCYKGSFVASASAAWMIAKNNRQRTWHTAVDRFIATSDFVKAKFVSAGFPADRLVVKANFVGGLWGNAVPECIRTGGLFVGRLSEEKGIRTLVAATEQSRREIRLVGDGPLLGVCNSSSVVRLGRLSPEKIRGEMRAARYLVVPSIWYEGWPMVIAEAFASGLPVIASRVGALAEIVKEGETGLLITPGSVDELADRIEWASTHPDEMARMGRNARLAYEERFTPAHNYKELLAIYREAIAHPCSDRAVLSSHHR